MVSFPPFVAHPLLRGGHVQTLAGLYLPGHRSPYAATPHTVPLPDGDAIVLHDDCPPTWQPGGRAALLIHGLAGCHGSPYMVRVAAKLNAAGVRTFRMDLRGCGAGLRLARLPYHAGRSDDALAALREIERLCPTARLAIVGFSLGGNITLKLLGEAPDLLPERLEEAVAVNPPIDLAACVKGLNRPATRIYDRYFVRLLCQRLAETQRHFGPAAPPTFSQRPTRLLEFDDRYTAPVSGFGRADTYYARCSAAQFVPHIRARTLILTSRDDPLVPVGTFETVALPPAVALHITQHGGHVGYIGRSGVDPDRRWMEWRIVDWLTATP
jgi:hypothetical protein